MNGTAPRPDELASKKMQDTAELRGDFIWWSFYWTESDGLFATYLGVGPTSNVNGYSVNEVRSKIEQVELHKQDELKRLIAELPQLRIWSSESGMLYAVAIGAQTSSRTLITVLQADSVANLREQIAKNYQD
jgi:hypothetical protein